MKDKSKSVTYLIEVTVTAKGTYTTTMPKSEDHTILDPLASKILHLINKAPINTLIAAVEDDGYFHLTLHHEFTKIYNDRIEVVDV